jgi:hypothetical protein
MADLAFLAAGYGMTIVTLAAYFGWLRRRARRAGRLSERLAGR